jgi:hypothetical protein
LIVEDLTIFDLMKVAAASKGEKDISEGRMKIADPPSNVAVLQLRLPLVASQCSHSLGS